LVLKLSETAIITAELTGCKMGEEDENLEGNSLCHGNIKGLEKHI
jgi:hypothetical protein